jgi:hypothetical protein
MKVATALLGSAMIFGGTIVPVRAEICWRLSPFGDVVRVAETTFVDEAVEGTHTLVVGNWAGGNSYALPIVGSIDTNVPRTTPPTLRLGVHGTNHTIFFANHSDCTLDAQLGGVWKLSCDGNVAGIFNNGGGTLNTFTLISCDTVSTSALETGNLAGR